MPASYRNLHASGELARRSAVALARLNSCDLCPRRCRVDREAGETGFCRTGRQAHVASYCPHFGEEAPLVGHGGSGTIFFGNCNLGCVFCQNWEISHGGEKIAVHAGQLAAIMLSLQKQGCHNINLVTPSHVVPQIIEALVLAVDRGLVVPLVYNSSGYDAVTTLELLDGIIDIYMPDFKFWFTDSARTLAKAADYPEQARLAISEMHRQVGDLQVEADGLARQGLLVRHLVMPGGNAETVEIMRFLAEHISPDTYVNLMDQYRPCGEANQHPAIARALTVLEYRQAVELTTAAGLKRLDRPDFDLLLRRLGILQERQ